MQILLADLDATVTAVILKIRDGVQAARDAGVVAELPEEVQFSVEVISGYQTLDDLQVGSDTKTGTNTANKPAITTTTTRGASSQTNEETTESESSENRSSAQGTNSQRSYFWTT